MKVVHLKVYTLALINYLNHNQAFTKVFQLAIMLDSK